MEYTFQANVRIRNHGKAKSLWYFITVPKIYSDDITKYGGLQPRKGRSSVKVEVMAGFTKRETSVILDKESGSYLLPIKSSIRKELQIEEGSQLYTTIKLI